MFSTPFILLLFDLVIASNDNLQLDRWKDKQNLFKLLAIIGIREKLIEPRAINQTQPKLFQMKFHSHVARTL